MRALHSMRAPQSICETSTMYTLEQVAHHTLVVLLSFFLLVAWAGCATLHSSDDADEEKIGTTDEVVEGITEGTTVIDEDDETEKRGATRISELLKGQTAGVRVSEERGGIKVRIRGEGTLQGSNDPLYVVDGQPREPQPGGVLTAVAPRDVESIRVLKNPDETAIYGSRGKNGVVVITTKSQ